MSTKTWYRILFTIIRPFVGLYYPIKVYGRENIPEGGALVCANHSSAIDPLLIAFALTKKHPICAMAKESLLKIPMIGRLLKLVGTFGVKRGASDIHAVKYAMQQLKQGEYVVLFPEGHVGSGEAMTEFKSGMVLISMQSKRPIVPIYMKPRKHWYSRLKAVIGEPVDITEMYGDMPAFSKIDEITKLLREREEALEEIAKDM